MQKKPTAARIIIWLKLPNKRSCKLSGINSKAPNIKTTGANKDNSVKANINKLLEDSAKSGCRVSSLGFISVSSRRLACNSSYKAYGTNGKSTSASFPECAAVSTIRRTKPKGTI